MMEMKKRGLPPTFAVIGGSQAYRIIAENPDTFEKLDRIDTPFGASQPIYKVSTNGGEFFFISRHGDKRYSISPPFVNYSANIYALKELGVKQILSWSAPAATNKKYKVGQFAIIDDVIDETKSRQSTFFRFKGLGFIRQNPLFCPTLRNALRAVLSDMSLDYVDGGVYVCTEGPRLETVAEAKKYALLGGDLVGMTVCPEVFLARELEMCYVTLCYVANYAEGVVDRPYKSERLLNGLANRREMRLAEKSFLAIPLILNKIMQRLQKEKMICKCQETMKRYRTDKNVGENWREWMKP